MFASRRAAPLVGAVIVATVLAACSGGASPSASTSAPSNPPPATAAATAAPAGTQAATTAPSESAAALAPATIQLWWQQYEQDTTPVEAAIKAFEEANPGVDVEISYYSYDDYSKAMPAALAAGNPPDLAFGDPTPPNVPNFVKAGQLDKLQPLVDQYGWADALKPGVITFYNPLYGGETYAIPLFAAQRGVFYNKDILDKVGGTVPNTLSEFEALLDKVKAAGYTPLAMGDADKYGPDYYWLGLILNEMSGGEWKAFREGTMTWTSGTPWGGDAVRKATERLLSWRDKGYFNDDFAALNSDDLNKDFVAGKIFAIANGANLNQSIKDASPAFQVGFMDWPASDATPDIHLYPSDPGQVLILPKDSKNKTQAVALMDYLITNPEVARTFAQAGRIPLSTADLGTISGQPDWVAQQLAVSAEQTPTGWLTYMAPYEFPDREGSEMQKLLAGETTLDAFMPFLQKTYDEAVANAQ